ncbi:unnamed protein product [Durusdinium trenchii]|uniref:Pentatricopeptide repeat-containing protein, chloroplastic n=1 Tax=Durusdinium trenchii TaxID=1381693 RepID=A0ABP0IZ94_9DINO
MQVVHSETAIHGVANGHANGHAVHVANGHVVLESHADEGANGAPLRGSRNGRSKAPSVTSLLEAQQWRAALWTLESPRAIDQMTSEIRLKACNGCISACGRASLWTQAMALMNGMKAMVRMPSPTSVSFSACALACERALQWSMILGLLERGRLDRLLREKEASGRSGRQRAAELASLTAACRACDRAERWRSSLELIPKMLQGSLEPNVFTFGSAFQVCQHGNGLKALELYQEMRQLHVESGIISCNQVMAACSSSQLWEESLELMAGARREALESTVVTVSSAVKNDLAWFQVFQVLFEAQKAQVQCNEIVRGTALTSCSRDVAFAWQRATASLAQEAQEGLAPNVFSYSAAMKVSSLWRKVLGFLPRRASGVPRWRDPDRVVAMNLVADTCVKGQPFQWPLVMQLLDRDLQAAGLEPDLFSADHLIEALPQWRVALHLVKEELLDEDAQVNLASKVVHENWELALSLLPARGRKKSNLVLLSVMAYRGRWHEVLRRLEGLADEEPSDRESVCNAVCTAFDNGSQWPLALRFLEGLLHQRTVSSSLVYNWAITFLTSGRAP